MSEFQLPCSAGCKFNCHVCLYVRRHTIKQLISKYLTLQFISLVKVKVININKPVKMTRCQMNKKVSDNMKVCAFNCFFHEPEILIPLFPNSKLIGLS